MMPHASPVQVWRLMEIVNLNPGDLSFLLNPSQMVVTLESLPVNFRQQPGLYV